MLLRTQLKNKHSPTNLHTSFAGFHSESKTILMHNGPKFWFVIIEIKLLISHLNGCMLSGDGDVI
jgi:hypothetical protein